MQFAEMFENTNNAHARQAVPDLDGKNVARVVINHVERAKWSPARQSVVHEIQ